MDACVGGAHLSEAASWPFAGSRVGQLVIGRRPHSRRDPVVKLKRDALKLSCTSRLAPTRNLTPHLQVCCCSICGRTGSGGWIQCRGRATRACPRVFSRPQEDARDSGAQAQAGTARARYVELKDEIFPQ